MPGPFESAGEAVPPCLQGSSNLRSPEALARAEDRSRGLRPPLARAPPPSGGTGGLRPDPTGSSPIATVESTDIPHSGTYTRCRTYRRRRPWPTRTFPTSPPSRVSKRSGMPRGTRTARTCSTARRAARSAAQESSASTLPRRRPRGACTSATSSRSRTPTSRLRFERMRGKTVFYPMGWDDNGLPTERRVQNYYGVRCDPSLPYDADFAPPVRGRRQQEQPRRRPGGDQPPQLHRAVREADRRGREALRGAVPPARAERRLDADLPHDLGRHDPHEPARVPAQPRARRGLPGARPHALGHRLPLRDRPGRARRPRPAGRLPPGRLPQDRRLGRRAHRDDPARAARRVRRPRRAPRRRALPAALRHDRAHPALRRRGARCSRTRSRSPTRARASR